MRVREIKTKAVMIDGRETIVADRDENGNEIEVSGVDVPIHIEAAEGTASERRAIITAFVSTAKADQAAAIAAATPSPNEAA